MFSWPADVGGYALAVSTINWGSVPEWLAGGGAIIALLFARSAVRAARAMNEQQSAQIAALERAEAVRYGESRAKYASRFACWVTLPGEGEMLPAVGLMNSNEVPFYRDNLCWNAARNCIRDI